MTDSRARAGARLMALVYRMLALVYTLIIPTTKW